MTQSLHIIGKEVGENETRDGKKHERGKDNAHDLGLGDHARAKARLQEIDPVKHLSVRNRGFRVRSKLKTNKLFPIPLLPTLHFAALVKFHDLKLLSHEPYL